MILVNWRLPVCQLSGFGNLDNFTLDIDMLKCIKPDPVLFAVTVDGIAYTQDSRVTVSPGTAVRIDASVTNTTDITYEQISITFEPYQDYANGYRATDLHGKVAWVGELSTNSPNKLPPGNTVGHSCSFVFFYPGDFMIQIACTEAANAHDSQGTSAATSRNLVHGVNAGSSLGMNRGTDPTASTTWTFSPILRITVVT
ncbi:predicted protein [Nematostella vectensis]|uniref:Trs120/TRAPPC9 fourth Ig-like domain-containing protein n=1 Tax=Nematostella vectensis TaxID=45351 RepID=A7T860_NEMVE|nr:predicted protein [Nematostella vectensis]|eukprot:XP_001619934.1 hypothetical protein NEMVEDRAFT_v1g248813 [Nematostella vectensis]